jgi:hypothetical protein
MRIDALLGEIVDLLETSFPQRVAGYYVQGSFADATGSEASDIDLTIVFRDHFTGDEEQLPAVDLLIERSLSPATRIDLQIVDEAGLAAQVGLTSRGPSFKYGSLLIYGRDSRPDLTLLTPRAWARQCMHGTYRGMLGVVQRPRTLVLPLTYPEPDGEFFGYDHPPQPPGFVAPHTTRTLVTTTGWLASALVASAAHIYVVRKRDFAPLYRRYIGDRWAAHLEQLYTLCGQTWRYGIPAEAQQRRALRELCRENLSFEHHFLLRYNEYLVRELRGGEREGRLAAMLALGYYERWEEAIGDAVRALVDHADDQTRQAAADLLAAHRRP